ncbi:MAG: PEP-CTERM sorting domain-containing protein [Pseudomonadota bacterium]|nr:PEP-CTERM sorting domain-containing protein [Pseudomonadota bacterium]
MTDQASWNSLPGESDQNGPLIFDLDKLDKVENGGNEDGFVIIDVDVSKTAFKISESDVILKTTGGTVAIFRADGKLVQFDFDDSSIMKGEDDWDKIDNPLGLEGDPITDLVAMFVVDTYNETNEVFDLDNVILGGIALYGFIDLGGEGKQTTVIDIDNGQGCVQFVSNHVDLQNTRWNRCTASFETPGDDREMPEPGTLAMFAFGIFGLAIARRRRKVS